MPNRDVWREKARAHRGNLVLWIEQAADAGLKQANSNGVCHAITRAWIESYMQFTEDRSIFVNSFREYDDQDRLVKEAIPEDYLSQQGIYQGQVEAYNSTLATARQLASTPTDEKGRQVLRQLVEGCKRLQRDLYGNHANVERPEPGTSVVQVIGGFPVHPCYVMLSMRAGTGGHVVGFDPSLRRDPRLGP